VTLGWLPPPSGDMVASFVIEAGSFPGAANLVSYSTGTSALSFAAANVPRGTYYVRVRAMNALGVGPASNEAVVVVGSGGGCTLPGPPGTLALVANSGGTIVLSWSPAQGGATSYSIEGGTGSTLANVVNSNVGLTTTLTASNVSAGTYYVRVRAQNGCGTGPPSNEVIVAVGAPATTLTQNVLINCTSAGQLCSPPAQIPFSTPRAANLQLRLVLGPLACSPVRFFVSVDNALRITTAFAATPGALLGPFDLGNVTAGAHSVSLQGEGQTSGCNFGRVLSWAAEATLTLQPG
jgi:hypothetical protein